MKGHIRKGQVLLQVLRCARGSTSLESFHLHLARFIPGTSAGAVNFQAYILDGICRWNSARASEAVQQTVSENLRTFNSKLQARVNELSRSMKPPSKYMDEQFGVQYLYQQSGITFTTTPEQLNSQIDEGFADVDEMDQPAVSSPPEQDEHLTTVETRYYTLIVSHKLLYKSYHVDL